MKRFLSLAVAAIMSVASFAQVEAGHCYIQPQAGVTFAKCSGDGRTTDMKTGFVGGLEFGYQYTEQFGVSLGALYAMQGAVGATDSALPGKKWSYDYLNVPVLFQYSPIEFLSLKAGVQPGFLLSSKFEGEKKDGTKSFDFAIPVGVSFEFSNFVIDARYNIGVTSVEEESSISLTNKAIQITLGYKFQL